MTTYKLQLAYTLGQMPGRESEAKTAMAKLVELYSGFTIETFYEVIRSFNFTEPYMELAAVGLRKAGLDIPDELAAGD